MRLFRRYIFPAVYGLLIYFTIRLLHDIDVDAQFWKRDWRLNAFEMFCSIVLGYLSIWLFKRLLRYGDKRWPVQFTYHNLVYGLLLLLLANLALVNLVLIPMAAFTDDGLSWADFVGLNVIPALYTIIYYGIDRSRVWLSAYVESKLQFEKLSREQLATELKFLKAQYHPHFLFNALNTIYFQMDEDLGGAKKSIEKFSELLRYQLYDQQQQVPVVQEIEYLKSYIGLQKIRSSAKLKLNVDIDPKLSDQLVYPLLFLPLVENAFKFIGGDYHLLIEARLEGNQIKLCVENSLSSHIPIGNKIGGIGLENLRRRLSLLYPGKHQLNIETKQEVFKAELIFDYEG
ncbi:MAG: histidine kinase [Pedobacter sp.]|jgi:two-component system LytT family sensor kinase|nr:histidine kinase [Pedobacter sp.]